MEKDSRNSSMEEEKEFEFGSCAITPAGGGSPGSPADHLFLNGKLLPHSFPSQPSNYGITYSRSTSRTSSVSSKDSFFSSRSNSTNSARTSTSERVLINQPKVQQVTKDGYRSSKNKPALRNIPQYGSSRRWQFIMSVPVLNHQTSSRSRKSGGKFDERINSKGHVDIKEKKTNSKSKAWFGQRVFMSFVSACIECHAIKTSSTV